jgi:prophage antirepressor-like protein
MFLNFFNNTELKSFVDEDGVLWFHGYQACKILQYSNPSVSILANTDEDERQKVDLGGLEEVWFISESGLYQMAFQCRKPVAKPFKRWLSREVIPAIRKEGAYISPTITKDQALATKIKLDRILDTPSPWKRMYDKEACEKAFAWYGANFYWTYCYSWMTPGEQCKVNRLNPPINGKRDVAIHQFIDQDIRDRLTPHVTRLVDFLVSSTSKQDFETRMGRVFGSNQLELPV